MLKRDNDGHRYNVPMPLESRFDELLDAINDSKFGSDEWYDANDLLDDEFGKYMTGE